LPASPRPDALLDGQPTRSGILDGPWARAHDRVGRTPAEGSVSTTHGDRAEEIMAARTGRQFLDGLRKTHRTVWVGDERIDDVTAHPALAGAARTLAGAACRFVGSGLGGRNLLYERFYLTSASRNRITAHQNNKDRSRPDALVDSILAAGRAPVTG
jgi:hypothetical protein